MRRPRTKDSPGHSGQVGVRRRRELQKHRELLVPSPPIAPLHWSAKAVPENGKRRRTMFAYEKGLIWGNDASLEVATTDDKSLIWSPNSLIDRANRSSMPPDGRAPSGSIGTRLA